MLVRKLITRLECLEAVRLIETLDEQRVSFPSVVMGPRPAHSWRRDLRYTLRDRARMAAEAVDHATGVYFPRRAHAARIAIKKLRYAMEIAEQTATANLEGAIRELKKHRPIGQKWQVRCHWSSR
jgi:CHAD domain-containing protein